MSLWTKLLCLTFLVSLCIVFHSLYQIVSSHIAIKQGIELWNSIPNSSPTSDNTPIFGKISFPSIQKEYPVVQGVSDIDLIKGVGYDPATPSPGQIGNSVLAGHRDTVFRKLGQLRKGDQIIVETKEGTFTYKIVESTIVSKHNKHAVQQSSQESLLTIITCYPFTYLGDAPNRYIITAALVHKHTKNHPVIQTG